MSKKFIKINGEFLKYNGSLIKAPIAEVLNIDTSDATATSSDIAKDKTAYVNGVKVVGTHECEAQSVETQTKSVALSMANGNQVVTPDTGKYFTSVTIQKPSTLIPSNILNGIDIGGVIGTYTGDIELETKSVALSMNSGNQVVTSTDGKALSSVTITKPSTLTPENVKLGVNIGGVVGTYADAETEEKSATLNFSSVSVQNVVPSTGKLLSKVSINKPDTLMPENIKIGINIAGIEGTYTADESEEKSVELNFTTTPQVVTPTEGKVLSKVSINKPVKLTPENIKKGVTIAGVKGTYDNFPTSIEIDQDNLWVNKTFNEVYVATSNNVNIGANCTIRTYGDNATITADNLTAENIKKGVNILGVTGTLEPGITPTGTLDITTNGTHDVTTYASVNVNVPTPTITFNESTGELTINDNN